MTMSLAVLAPWEGHDSQNYPIQSELYGRLHENIDNNNNNRLKIGTTWFINWNVHNICEITNQ